MKIGVIGGGFAGLACCWHLSGLGQVTLFDGRGVGGGASSVAAGLLHPYAGRRGRKNWEGDAGMRATMTLLQVAEGALGRRVAVRDGVLRLPVDDVQRRFFRQTLARYPDVEWRDGGFFIPRGIAVDSTAYLEGLWLACERRGAKLRVKRVSSLEVLKSEFDIVVLAAGVHSAEFAELPLTPVKGQILRLAWPSACRPLPYPISAGVYAMMAGDGRSVFVGATFEHDFESSQPDLELAYRSLMPRVAAFLPELADAQVLDVLAGVRASTSDHLPIMRRLDTQTWTLCGLGSKGLLYHALLAERMRVEISASVG